MERVGDADHVADGVYIAGARAIYGAAALREAGITRVLKLYFDGPYWPEDFTVCESPLDDGEFVPFDALRCGVAFIQESVAAGEKVLVVCGAGISRSATFVLAYLLERGDDVRAAWQLLRARHPDAFPALELWESLIAHYDLPYTVMDFLDWPDVDEPPNPAAQKDGHATLVLDRLAQSTAQGVMGVDHVLDGVYIASSRAAYRAAALRKIDLTRVLKLYPGEPAWPEDFVVCDNPVTDGEFLPLMMLERGLAFIHEALAAEGKALVVCWAGMSRSATFVLAYLLERGYDLREAWDLLRKQHPQSWPLPELWRSLLVHYDLPYSMEDVRAWWRDERAE